MLRQCAILVLIGVTFTLEKPSRYEFTKNTCQFDYGIPLGQKETINDMHCVKACVQHENCTSLMYERATRQCFLNAEVQKDWSQFPADCGVQYAAPSIIPVKSYYGCDEGWQYFAGRCYFYLDKLLTWYGCDEYCIKQNSYLAKLYNISTYDIPMNVTQTAWMTTIYKYLPYITVNDLLQENLYTDRDGVPINPELLPTVYIYDYVNTADCGVLTSGMVYIVDCKWMRTCLCEREPRHITRPRPIY